MDKIFSWDTVSSLFKALNDAGVKYVVLRNYEEMHKSNFFCEGHEDIDLLCEDAVKFAEVAHAIPKMWPEDTIHYVVFIGDEGVPVDVRMLGDSYYDNKWEARMLDERKLADNGNWYVMQNEDYYYSLTYHSILQKEVVSPNYIYKLNGMAEKIGLKGFTAEDHLRNLDAYMREKNYSYVKPNDNSVPFHRGLKDYRSSMRKRKFYQEWNGKFLSSSINLTKQIGIYTYLRDLLYNKRLKQFDNTTGKFSDIEKISTKIMKKSGENVYDQLAQRKVYRYLSRYENEIDEMYNLQKIEITKKKKQECHNAVFTMWWQGIDEMPEVVKSCTKSLDKLRKEVIILTKENVKDYVSLPDYIWEKFENGIISRTHLSDIIRVAVIAMYGGVWIDSTVYIADTVPSYMTEELFVFKQSPQLREVRSYANWWIAAPAGNNLIIKQLSALLVYWKHETKLLDYYIFHILWKKNIDLEPKYQEELNKILERYTDTTHLLLRRYDKIFNEEEWELLKQISPVFKCTYKWKGVSRIDTYYSKLCMEELP